MKDTTIHIQRNSYQNKLKKTKVENIILSLKYIFFINHSLKAFKNKQISCVDIGCGEGRFARTFLRIREKISKLNLTKFTGLDASNDIGIIYQENVPNSDFVLDNAEKLIKLKSNSYDLVCSHHNIEHLYNPYSFIKACNRVLKNGAYLYLSCPNPSSISGYYFPENWIAFKTPEHVSLKPPYVYRKWLKSNGFQIIKDGTTFLSSNPLVKKIFFLKVMNDLILLIFKGCIPWPLGDAYVCIAKKVEDHN